MTPYSIGSIIGGLLGTYLFAKLTFWATRSWSESVTKIVVCYLGLGLILVLGDAFARSYPADLVRSAIMFAPVVLVIGAIDLVAYLRSGKPFTHAPSP